jgi:hypothetical protein
VQRSVGGEDNAGDLGNLPQDLRALAGDLAGFEHGTKDIQDDVVFPYIYDHHFIRLKIQNLGHPMGDVIQAGIL